MKTNIDVSMYLLPDTVNFKYLFILENQQSCSNYQYIFFILRQYNAPLDR